MRDAGRGIRFQLREGLRFSDGTPFTADDAEKLLAAADKQRYQVKQLHHADGRHSHFRQEHTQRVTLIQ